MPQPTEQPRGVAVVENPPQLIRQVQRRLPLPAEAPFPPNATLELARVWVDDSSKVSSRRVRSASAPGAVSVTVRAGGTMGRPGCGSSAGWMKFTAASFGGLQPFGQAWGERVIYWKRNSKRMNDDETAFDYVVVVLDRPMGELTGYAGYRTFDQSWVGGSYWQNLGYPGDIGGGTKPSFAGAGAVSSVAQFTSQSQVGYLIGNFIDYQPGQSGGPYWGWWSGEPWPRVVGTASTLPDVPSQDDSGDNEGGGGPALSSLIGYARAQYP